MYALTAVSIVSFFTVLALLISGKQLNLSIAVNSEVWAATIGAVLGTVGAYLIGVIVEKRNNKKHLKEIEEQKIGAHYRALMLIEIRLQTIFITLHKNKRLLSGISSTITEGAYTITPPRTVPDYEIVPTEIRNNQLLNEWINMEFKLNIVNQLIEDFNRYYSDVGSAVHDMQIRSQKLNQAAMEENIKTISELSKSVSAAVDTVLDIAGPILIITRHLSNHTNSSSLQELIEYRISDEAISKELPSIAEEFSADMFKDI